MFTFLVNTMPRSKVSILQYADLKQYGGDELKQRNHQSNEKRKLYRKLLSQDEYPNAFQHNGDDRDDG